MSDNSRENEKRDTEKQPVNWMVVHIVEAVALIAGAALVICLDNRSIYVPFIFALLVTTILTQDKLRVIYSLIFNITFQAVFLICPIPGMNQEADVATFIVSTIGLIVVAFIIYRRIDINQKALEENDKLKTANEELALSFEKKSEEARLAFQSKTLFLSNISHEMRTPLNGILGMSEMIKRESEESGIREYSGNIEKSGKRLLAVLNDIIDYSRIESEELTVTYEDTYIKSLINDLTPIIADEIEEKNLKFNIILNPFVPECVSADKVQLRRILSNLLYNAAGYTEEGVITLKVDCEKTEAADEVILIFDVIDTGCGIKQEDIGKLFVPFGRAGEKEHYRQGTGMGLAIARKMLELMNGEIRVESEYGKGTRFTVSVKCHVVSGEEVGEYVSIAHDQGWSAAQSQPAEKGIFQDKKILVVDDVSVNLKVFKGLLKNTGAEVDIAFSGNACIAMVSAKKYDIIFLDYMMPEMDGIETLNALNEIPGFKGNTPVIMLTANTEGEKDKYIYAGFDDYMLKPLKKDKLIEMIGSHIKVEETAEPVETVAPSNTLHFEFLDYEEGLRNCDSDEGLLMDVVREYLETEKTKELDNFFKKEDWKNYEILVHSIKSTSKTIGALDLSEEFKFLEMAAKHDDVLSIKDSHEKVYADYVELLSKIKSALEGKNDAGSDYEELLDNRDVVFVVDDDRTNLKLASGILKKHFIVETFVSGSLLFEALEKQIPALVLLDIKMPEMTGFEVMEKLKASEKFREIPVIFLTSDEDTDTEVSGFKSGAMDFIKKPFVAPIMLERVNRIIELYQLRRYLEGEVNRKSGKVEKLSLQAMQTLALTIDAKDKYTNGHSTRVAQYSREISRRLELPEEEQESIYYMGLLHDIGKIGVPDSIINKAGKLTDEEFAAIKKHPEIGHGILKNITEIPDIEKGARWHHERFDGKGYPDGLKGYEIPLFARIIAVADSYDAMTSKRSYRDVLSQDYVRGELDRGRGTQFDTRVVDVMLSMIDEDTEYNMREK